MASAASPVCILLVYGIPGSGKTTLSRALLEHCKGEEEKGVSAGEASQAKGEEGARSKWNWFAVHFDEFFPPDLREKEAENKDGSQFRLKQARQRIHSYLEHFISVNRLGSVTAVSSTAGSTTAGSSTAGSTTAASTTAASTTAGSSANASSTAGSTTAGSSVNASSTAGSGCSDNIDRALASERPSATEWNTFVTSLRKHCSEPGALDANGRIVMAEGEATVLVLDDNMPLRSMRYEYYQLARTYLLGYAEVCIQCSLSVALERNSKRPIPIPHSTIESMERRIELPEPAQHHWEKRSMVVRSDCDDERFIHTTVEKVYSLVDGALRHPVQPLPQVDTTMKEICKLANFSSYVHQADNTLRRCISQLMQKPSDPAAKEAKASLARKANTVRKQVLEELRAGQLSGKPLASVAGENSANSEEFRRIITETFKILLKE